VNVHGRYIGQGPLILSVRSIDIVLADGSLVHADRTTNSDIFYGAIGGYGGLGIIVQAELDLADNVAVKRSHLKMETSQYHKFFFDNVRDHKPAVFHNGDLYPPHYKKIRGVTWSETQEKPTVKTRLMPLKDSYPAERYFLWAFTETMLGMWRREFIIEPLVYLSDRIHWRNYEAGYDVAELEPKSRSGSTYVLQEYFSPVARFDEFVVKMSEIFQRNKVNVVNVSVRHALPDNGSYMAWAREEVFAFVVYYKQKTDKASREKVARWTRELIDAAISVGGSYYLPYQAHATQDQFMKAYPNAGKMFALKSKLDPDYKFRNVLWDKYYAPSLTTK
jgi:FAD/FMN-containing dehydrogenase